MLFAFLGALGFTRPDGDAQLHSERRGAAGLLRGAPASTCGPAPQARARGSPAPGGEPAAPLRLEGPRGRGGSSTALPRRSTFWTRRPAGTTRSSRRSWRGRRAVHRERRDRARSRLLHATVFEVASERLGAQNAILGGGRYDGLVAQTSAGRRRPRWVSPSARTGSSQVDDGRRPPRPAVFWRRPRSPRGAGLRARAWPRDPGGRSRGRPSRATCRAAGSSRDSRAPRRFSRSPSATLRTRRRRARGAPGIPRAGGRNRDPQGPGHRRAGDLSAGRAGRAPRRGEGAMTPDAAAGRRAARRRRRADRPPQGLGRPAAGSRRADLPDRSATGAASCRSSSTARAARPRPSPRRPRRAARMSSTIEGEVVLRGRGPAQHASSRPARSRSSRSAWVSWPSPRRRPSWSRTAPTPPRSSASSTATSTCGARRCSQNFVLRDEIAFRVRKVLHERGFLEVETPMLTRSTPEGARDFLVPVARPPRQVLRAAAVAAALQADPDDVGLREVLPDRPLLPRRGPSRGPPVRVHADRPRDVLPDRRRTSSTRSRRSSSRPSRPRGSTRGPAVPAADLSREAMERVRDRPAGPALRAPALRPLGGRGGIGFRARSRRRWRSGGTVRGLRVPGGAAVLAQAPRRADREGARARRGGLLWVEAAGGETSSPAKKALSEAKLSRAPRRRRESRTGICCSSWPTGERGVRGPRRAARRGRARAQAGRRVEVRLLLGHRVPAPRQGRDDGAVVPDEPSLHRAARGGPRPPGVRSRKRARPRVRRRRQRLGARLGLDPNPPRGPPGARLPACSGSRPRRAGSVSASSSRR